MTQKWESWTSDKFHYNPVRTEVIPFKPKVVEELPDKIDKRGNKNYYITKEALELAKENKGKWILSYQQDIESAQMRRRRAASMRSSLTYMKSKTDKVDGRVITIGSVVELYIKYE
tara:strand:+ start:1156 stop:1503 length:348 start_codon:yes stop_codon:yes gene_type:complete